MGSLTWTLNSAIVMNRNATKILQDIVGEWNNAIASMRRMYPSFQLTPKDAHQIFQIDGAAPDDVVKFNVGPIIFEMPERVGSRSHVYVVVNGWLSFGDGDLRQRPLRTKSFGTKIGYFRRTGQDLEHVYGIHYDLDEELVGHPVFHGQVSSQPDGGQTILDSYRLTGEIKNNFQPKISNIRVPTAQMDVFSAILQLSADHLLHQNANTTVLDAFIKLRSDNRFFLGAAHRMPFLSAPPANGCYRSVHWYRD